MPRSLLFMLGAVIAAISASPVVQAQDASMPVVRTALNPLVYGHLPIMLAKDLGYFTDEKINVVVTKYNGSSTTQMPLVARGDLDIVPVAAGPGLFNAPGQGFDIKVIGQQDDTHEGWNDATWVIVRKDLWDSGAIRKIADLKGHAVDAGPDGSPINALMRGTLTKAGLTTDDVKFTKRLGTPPDWLAALRNKAVDALSAVEPIASQLVKQGLGVKLVSPHDVLSWYPSTYYIASSDYIRNHRPATVAFLKAIVRAQRHIAQGGPVWTPELVKVLSNWSQMSEDDIRTIPTPPYYGNSGAVSVARLGTEQDFWASLGLIKQKVNIADIVDTTPMHEARVSLGIE